MDLSNSNDTKELSLFMFQVLDIFNRQDVEALLGQPKYAQLYPEFIAEWKSSDQLTKDRSLLPQAILLEIARDCKTNLAFYADIDNHTLHGGVGSKIPHETLEDGTMQQMKNVTRITPEQAMRDYGVDAVWLVSDRGRSFRGERYDTYRNVAVKAKAQLQDKQK